MLQYLAQVYPNFGPENSFVRGLVGGLWLSPLLTFLGVASLATGILFVRQAPTTLTSCSQQVSKFRREKKDGTNLGDQKNPPDDINPDQLRGSDN